MLPLVHTEEQTPLRSLGDKANPEQLRRLPKKLVKMSWLAERLTLS